MITYIPRIIVMLRVGMENAYNQVPVYNWT